MSTLRAATLPDASRLRRLAVLWTRWEIPLLSLIYLILVLTDSVSPIAFALLASVWLARWATTGRLTRTTLCDLPIVVILALVPVTLWITTSVSVSLPKVYGIVLGVAFYYAVVNAVVTRRDLAWAVFWLAGVSAAIALAGLVGTDWAQGKIVSASFIYDRLPRLIQGIPRSIAGGFARNGVGGTLTLIVPLLAALFWARLYGEAGGPPRRLYRILLFVALGLSVLALALTQSRGAILGTAVGMLALLIWRDRRYAWVVAAGAAALVLLILLGQGGTLADFILRMDARSGTLASRIEVWERGWWMVQDFPFTGIGIGTYNAIAHAFYPFFIAAPDEVVAHAHNNLLEVAVDLGIPGLIAFLALLAGFVFCLVRAYRATADTAVRAVGAGLGFGMLAHQTFGLTDAFILGTKPGVLLWVFFALAVVLDRARAGWPAQDALKPEGGE